MERPVPFIRRVRLKDYRLTGMPVQRDTIAATSSPVTNSRSNRRPPCRLARFSSSPASLRASSGSRPRRSSAALSRS